MNKRIQELRNQASSYAHRLHPEEDSYGRPVNPDKFQQDRDTKFAELIVQECIAHIEEDRFYKVNLSETAYNAGYVDGMDHAESILKEHFGVE